jgi:glycoside/pentoside/hexuronide:cation symporter, GPH family
MAEMSMIQQHPDIENSPQAATLAPKLSLYIFVGWGTGTLAMSLMFQGVSLLILRYLVDYVGLAAGIAGLLIGLAKIYDAVTDPLMGTVSDRTRTTWGRRRPYLLLGGLVSAASFVLLFNLAAFQDLEYHYKIMVVGFALLLNATGYTIFNVPYLAMPAEMTNHFHERTKLISFRAGAVAVGGVMGTAIAPFLITAFGGGSPGHAAMSWMLGGVIVLASVLCLWMTRNAPVTREVVSSGPPFREQFRTAIENKPFMLLLGVKVAHLVGLAIYLSSMPFFFSVILNVSLSYMGLYFLVQSSFILISQFGWVVVTRRYGKNVAYYLAAMFYVVALFSWVFASEGEPFALIALRAVFTGLGAGGVLLIGQSLLPDTMQYDFQRTGIRREGVFSGVYTTVEKLSFAMGPALMGILLGAAGYIGGPEMAAAQNETSRLVIYAGVSVLPALGIACAGLIMTRYRLDEKTLNRGATSAS